MKKPNKLPPQDQIKKQFWYDSTTGIFRARFESTRCKAWRIVGNKETKGYLQINVAGKLYMAHRLAWMYETGQDPIELHMQIDHIDNNKTNNAISNLRLVTNKQNSENTGLNVRNKTGIKGVYMEKDRFVAEICHHYKRIKIGRFKTLDDAKNAVQEARQNLFTHFPPYPLGVTA